MQINMEEKAGVAVCRVKDDVDINSSPEVKKYFDQLACEKKEKVLISFEGVNYMDSSGLATLVEILKTMRSYGGKLKLCNLSDKIRGLFEITKLDRLFDI